MDSNSILDQILLLKIFRTIIFVGLFAFSTTYLIPKGILFFQQSKEKKSFNLLGAGINFIVAGIFILIYLLARLIGPSI